jgi:CheY-like chemotaxis protein/HPt (histidine-containing phosphotransfer) domain-containing protein
VDDALPSVLVSDVTRLRQILVNLIGNAVKFTNRGEVVVEVSATAHGKRTPQPNQRADTDFIRHPDEWVLHFSVRDTGIGIPVERQGRLFKSFQQVDTTRNYGGTGRGLAISKRLSELLGGRIWVESEAGRGATFHFTIVAKASTGAAPPAWQSPHPQLAGKRLLAIEDNATNQRVVAHRAGGWGMKVESAHNGLQAMAALTGNEGFDLILLDLELPDTDARELVRKIHSLSHRAKTPLILLGSVRVRPEDSAFGQLNVSGCIHKPIRPVHLLEAICRALQIQIQRERKPPPTPSLDPKLAQRLPLHVLLADDNLINQKVGLSVLHKLGYEPDLAENGLQVIAALDQRAYDILFLDVQMPEMDGLEAARQICARWPGSDKRPVIIAMTGNALMGDREKCLAAGMDDYISKPVRIGEVQAALERWGAVRLKAAAARAQATDDPDGDEWFDRSILAEMRTMPGADGRTMLQELIDLFLENAPQRLSEIGSSLTDPQKLAFHSHAFKSMSLSLGIKRLVQLSQTLEEQGRAGNLNGVLDLFHSLQSSFIESRTRLLSLRSK